MKLAGIEDIPEVLQMGMNFINSSPYKDFSSEEHVKELIYKIVMGDPSEGIVILKPEVGFILGVASPFLFGPHKLASEIGWWIEEDKRGNGEGLELLTAFEYWAKNVAQCKMISMVSLNKKIEAYYKKNGYKLYERAYMKVF